MRKLCMSLLFVGVTNFGFAQYAAPEFNNPIYLDIHPVHANVDYLNEVQGTSTPNQVKLIESEVSDWDPTKSVKFNTKNEQTFGATFKTKKGYIAADYDNKGNIVSTEERFENVALPRAIAGEIVKQYPGWRFVRSQYILKYTKGQASKKFFKVVLKKDNQKKRLKISA